MSTIVLLRGSYILNIVMISLGTEDGTESFVNKPAFFFYIMLDLNRTGIK